MKKIIPHLSTRVSDYFFILLGLLSYSFGYTAFIVPAKLFGGGVTGIATLISYASDGSIQIYVPYSIINIGLLIVGVIVIGPKFGIKTLYAIIVTTLLFRLFENYLPENLMGLADDRFLSTVVGGAMCGLGIGVVFSYGGSTGGTDIIAMIVNKYRPVSLGRLIMFFDLFIIGSSYFVLKDIPAIIYSYVLIITTGLTIDYILSGAKQTVQVMIFSPCYEDIADAITGEMHRGCSVLSSMGWYSKKEQKVLLVIARKPELRDMKRLIHAIDKKAFISISTSLGVYGKGFEEFKIK